MNVTVLKWLPGVDKTIHAIFCLNLKLHHAKKNTTIYDQRCMTLREQICIQRGIEFIHTHTHTHSFLTSRTRNHYHSNQTLVRNISNKKIACIDYFGQSFPMLHARNIDIQGIHLVPIIKILLCSLQVNMYNYQIIIYP